METNEFKSISTDTDPKEGPAPIPALKYLDVFVGKWHAEGESYAEAQPGTAEVEGNAKWISDETFEWLPGGYFLLHRWDGRVGSREFTGIEIFGYDELTKQYFVHSYDNMGNRPAYVLVLEDNSWIFREPSTRATVKESIDGSTMTWNWQWKHPHGEWLPLCDRVATRQR
jgi:hypothetical protein